jgi:hypothetical protein
MIVYQLFENVRQLTPSPRIERYRQFSLHCVKSVGLDFAFAHTAVMTSGGKAVIAPQHRFTLSPTAGESLEQALPRCNRRARRPAP